MDFTEKTASKKRRKQKAITTALVCFGVLCGLLEVAALAVLIKEGVL